MDQPKKPKSRALKYNWVVAYYLADEVGLEDFRKYIRATYKYKKLRKQFEKGRVSNEELMAAFDEVKSIRFIETEKDGRRMFTIV